MPKTPAALVEMIENSRLLEEGKPRAFTGRWLDSLMALLLRGP